MRPKDMLVKEAHALPEEITKRKDATDVQVSFKFGNDELHHIFPRPDVSKRIAEDLRDRLLEDTPSQNFIDDTELKEEEIPSEIIFHNRQAIGDILTMTCAIRDFKSKYPTTRVGVATTAMHIWDHNPNIDHSFRKSENVLKIGPGFLTNKSNRWNTHMANAFRLDIEQKLKLSIPQGDIKPDIWMTEEEYKRDPIIKGPYWVFIYGGEPGWPAKQYHKWQEVINCLRNDINIVQLGVKKHPYPILNGVSNYVGKTENAKTGLRDLFNIFLHAQGSIGLVSMHMHLSAAFGNPCVVVAGGREPAWFTNYYGHQYVQTNGTMFCSEHKACWACKLEGCKNLIKHNGKQVPKCVDIIEPEEIAEAVRKYYKGGRLEYGKKIPNTFFKNITKEAKIFSVPKPDDVDEKLLKKYGFEWGAGSVTDKDWMFIKDIFKRDSIKTVLEFGAGLSTLLFGTMADKVLTYETQPGWIKKISNMADPKKHQFVQWDGKKFKLPPGFKKFDFAFVDGPAGGPNREWSTKAASELADIVIVHDAGRVPERKWQAKYLEGPFELAAKGGHRCHLWRKTKPCVVDETKPLAKVITTCRGYGGSEKSTLKIMNMLIDKGYRVDLHPTGNICGPYLNDIPHGVLKRKWGDSLKEPCDLMVMYCSDIIWGFHEERFTKYMSDVNAKRKVMILNYQLGKAGQEEWTKGWDKYMFLNSTKESELVKRIPDAHTKVLPPPTDLREFLKVNVEYGLPLKLIRHNSQRDAKHPDYTNKIIRDVLRIDSSIEMYYMPPRSDTMDHPQVYKFRVNEVPVPEFLSKGNCFWYHLPPGYQDQGPRVIIEAMACGLPVIADNSYGAKDRVTPETGWLCDSYEEYLEVIKEIIKTPNILKIKGEAARLRAIKEFVPERWIEEIIDG